MALAEVCPLYAVCPGGEEAVLKTVELKGFAGSNPVHGANGITNEKDGLKNNLIFYKKFVIIFI